MYDIVYTYLGKSAEVAFAQFLSLGNFDLHPCSSDCGKYGREEDLVFVGREASVRRGTGILMDEGMPGSVCGRESRRQAIQHLMILSMRREARGWVRGKGAYSIRMNGSVRVLIAETISAMAHGYRMRSRWSEVRR